MGEKNWSLQAGRGIIGSVEEETINYLFVNERIELRDSLQNHFKNNVGMSILRVDCLKKCAEPHNYLNIIRLQSCFCNLSNLKLVFTFIYFTLRYLFLCLLFDIP